MFAGVKRDDRVVSEAAQRQYDERYQTLTKRQNDVDLAIAKLEGKGISLADLVGGGSGTGTGKIRQGIDPRSGVVQTRDFGDLGNVKVNHFTAVKLPFIDGVFIPDGRDGKAAIPVSSSGITITGLPTTSGQAWDAIRNGPVASQHSPVAGGRNTTFRSRQRSVFSLSSPPTGGTAMVTTRSASAMPGSCRIRRAISRTERRRN